MSKILVCFFFFSSFTLFASEESNLKSRKNVFSNGDIALLDGLTLCENYNGRFVKILGDKIKEGCYLVKVFVEFSDFMNFSTFDADGYVYPDDLIATNFIYVFHSNGEKTLFRVKDFDPSIDHLSVFGSMETYRNYDRSVGRWDFADPTADELQAFRLKTSVKRKKRLRRLKS